MMPELPVVAMPRNTPQPLKAVFPYPDTITKTPSNEILHAMFMRERISAIFDTWSSRVVDTFSEGVGLSLSLPEDSLISPSLPETLGSDPKCSDAGSLALLSVSVLRPLLRFSSSVPCFSLFCHHSQSSEKQCTVASKTAGEHWARDDHIFFLDKHFAHKTIEHQHHFVLVVNRRQHIESRQQGIYRDTKTIKESVSPF